MKQFIKKYNDSGFTLIELIVVIFILVIISSIVIANFRGGETNKSVTIAADTIVDALRTAQTDTLTGKNTGSSNPNCQIPLAYYVDFQFSNSFNLYADDSCSTTEQIQTYTLPINTTITNLNGANSDLKIKFWLPFATPPQEIIDNNTTGFTSASIAVKATNSSYTKTVIIDGTTGAITIK
jgi:prepilin-type N-terminal cleavage/methylation domain-containing protein